MWDQVHPNRVQNPNTPQCRNFLAHARPNTERFGRVGEEVSAREAHEEGGEDFDLSVPVAGGPYLSELGVEGFVKLVVDVGFVGAVTGSDPEVGAG